MSTISCAYKYEQNEDFLYVQKVQDEKIVNIIWTKTYELVKIDKWII